MTVYTKTMMDALLEVRGIQEDNMDLMRKAASKGGMQTLKMKDGKLKMDKVTASAIMQVYDKLNPANQKKMEQMINDGKKSGIIKVSDFAMSKVTGFKSEDIDLDEAREKGPRQLVNPNKEVMVVKKNKVVVIDKKDEDKYLKQGWSLAEEVDLDEATPDYHVKYAKTKKGPWKVTKFMTLDQAKEFLADVRKDGMNGMISVDGKPVKEETELDEAPKYELYHKDFSTAMQHAYKMAKKLHGITVKPSEIDDKVASGPKKPSEGKTNTYRLEGDKGAIQVQVYNKGGSKPYELNFYKEEVELDEALPGKWPAPGVKKGTRKDLEKLEKELQAAKKKKDKKKADALQKELEALMKSGKGKKIGPAWMHKEEVELDEMNPRDKILKKTADHLQALIKGSNNPDDKAAFAAARDYVEAGNLETVATIVKKLDTAPKEAIINAVAKGIGKKEAEKIFKVRILRVEEVDLDEGKMKELHGYIEDGKSAEWIAKKMGVDVKTIKALMGEAYEVGTDEYREYLEKLTPGEVDEASARADAKRAMKSDPSMSQDPFSKDDAASDEDIKGASKNIIMQMRKAVSMRGNFDVEFLDRKKKKVPVKIAQAVQDKFNSFKKPADKEKFQAQAAKSYNDMLKVLKAGYMMKAAYEETILERIDRKLKERKNG